MQCLSNKERIRTENCRWQDWKEPLRLSWPSLLFLLGDMMETYFCDEFVFPFLDWTHLFVWVCPQKCSTFVFIAFLLLEFSNIFKCLYYLPEVCIMCTFAKHFMKDARTMTKIAWPWYILVYCGAALIQCLQPNTCNLVLPALFNFLMY